jgi:hypothetical protein
VATIYDRIGGQESLIAVVDAFYERQVRCKRHTPLRRAWPRFSTAGTRTTTRRAVALHVRGRPGWWLGRGQGLHRSTAALLPP